jgi:hypothetical protein
MYSIYVTVPTSLGSSVAEAKKVSVEKKSVTHAAKARQCVTKKSAEKQHAKPAAQATVTVDRRATRTDRRSTSDRRVHQAPVAVERRLGERRAKVCRRRQIDPTTCERDYSPEEIEFMSAMDEYKRRSGRMFPTCSEVLEVVRSLGYEKRKQVEPDVPPPVGLPATMIETPTVVG